MARTKARKITSNEIANVIIPFDKHHEFEERYRLDLPDVSD